MQHEVIAIDDRDSPVFLGLRLEKVDELGDGSCAYLQRVPACEVQLCSCYLPGHVRNMIGAMLKFDLETS